MHDGNENGLGSNGLFNFVRINSSILIYANVRHRCPDFLQKAAGIEDGRMFYLRRDDVVSFLLQSKEDAFNRIIVGLAAATGKDDLVRMTMEKICHLLSGILNSFSGGHSCPMK